MVSKISWPLKSQKKSAHEAATCSTRKQKTNIDSQMLAKLFNPWLLLNGPDMPFALNLLIMQALL